MKASSDDKWLSETSGASPGGVGGVPSLNLRGYQHLTGGAAENAVVCFQQALTLAPDSPVLLNNLGNALFALSRLVEARDAYLRAVEVAPEYPKPYRNLAVLYQLVGRADEAVAAYRLYLELE